MTYLIIGIICYLAVAYFVYDKWFKNSKTHPQWEKIALSLSWICIIPLYGIRKIQELSN